ncbi:hypothetical protein BDF19DRAFT_434341 [Syncephalis fuscata]|nr:hypothetical protein BDF19DRAFT_434341 [Syncephalis fuscata]
MLFGIIFLFYLFAIYVMKPVQIFSVILLAVFLLLQLITFYLAQHYQHLPAIRHRSLSFTRILLVSYTLLVTNTLLALGFPQVYPCMLNPWVGGVILPSCCMVVICRFYRLAALYRWNARELQNYVKPRPVSALLESIEDENLPKGRLLKVQGQNDSATAVTSHDTMSSAGAIEQKLGLVDRLLDAYTDRRAIACTLMAAAILIIPSLLITILRPFHDSRPIQSCVINLIDMLPILISTLLIVGIGGGSIALRVLQARDAYGIRAELIASVAISLILITLSTLWVVYSYASNSGKRLAKDRLKFYDISGLLNGIGFIVCQFLIVNYPTLMASWNARNSLFAQKDLNAAVIRIRYTATGHLSFVSDLPAYSKQFEKLLDDPLELASFRSYCVGSFSIPACIFYEKFSTLQRQYNADDPNSGVLPHLLPQFVDQLEVLYRDFIVTGAPLPLTSILHPATLNMLRNAYNRRQICYDLLNDAVIQVKQHLYIWSYPDYIKAQNNK